jgi:hypothetical protein
MHAAERKKRIETYGGAHALLVEALKQFPQAMWHYRAAPDAWTIHEIVVHITDSEANSFIRARRAIAEPGSDVLEYDEMTWARNLDYAEQSPEDALELFRWLRGNTYKLIRRLPEAAWSQTFNHPTWKSTRLDQWLVTYDDHVPEHVRQMREVYAAWQKAGRP